MGKILVIVGCGLLAGCVTVEKTRERLASGNVEQIEQAKRDARRMALDRYLPEAERIAYVEMLTENDTLYEMLPFLHDNRSVQAAAIKKMSFAEEGLAAKFAKDYDAYDSILRRCLSDDVLSIAVSQMCAQADFDDLYAARKIFRVETSLENEMLDALLEKAMSDAQRVKVFDVCDDDKRRERALANVKDQNVLLDCLCTGLEESKAKIVAGYLSDETIIEFIRKDVRFVRFAEHKGAHCLCGKMKDPDKLGALLVDLAGPRAELCRSAMKILSDACLVKIIEEAKNEKLREYAPWDIRSVQAAERLFCGGKVSAKIQWALAFRLQKGAATRKMYEAASDEKVRKELLEKMPRELRKEIVK